MSALAASVARQITPNNLTIRVLKVAASTTIYKGSAVGYSGGYARALVAGDVFAGFADEEVDNSAGAAGDKSVRTLGVGTVFGVSVTGATGVTNLVAPNNDVFLSSDNDFTLTISGNSKCGHIANYDPVSGLFEVRFEANAYRSNT